MPMVTIIYVLVNLAYFAVVSRDEMLASVAVAVTFGNKVFGPVAWCIPIFVALSCFGKKLNVIFGVLLLKKENPSKSEFHIYF